MLASRHPPARPSPAPRPDDAQRRPINPAVMRTGATMVGKRIALVVGAAVLALTAACSGQGTTAGGAGNEGAPKSGGRLTMAISYDPAPLDPLDLISPADRQAAAAVYEPLVQLDQKGRLVPGLALSWKSTDAKDWTVALRPGVTFSDGTPFNAAAVVTNFERAQASKTCSSCASALSALDKVTAKDDLTVQFVLKTPLASFPAMLNDTYANMVSPAALRKYGDDIGKHPVGTGPFIMTARNAQGLTFKKNPKYWAPGKPYLDGLEMRIVPDAQGELAGAQAGDLDILTNTSDVMNNQAGSNPQMRVISVSGLGTNQIFLNNAQKPFDNVKARQALAMATDREALLKLSHPGGRYERVDGPWPSGMPITGGAVSSKFPAFDIARAKQLVAEVGGISFTLETYNIAGFPQQAQALQAMWAKAGIKAQIRLADTSTVIADANAQRTQAVITTWSGRPDPDLNSWRFLHSSAKSPAAVNDPQLDALLVQGRSSVDPKVRKEAYQKLVDRIGEIVPVVYFDGLKKSVIVNSGTVGGATPPPDGTVQPAGIWRRSGGTNAN
ncbi:hypothetical protein F8568_014705 [Actinomadura sp. LD22]|uniref:Solute-binding protein family 5 domain-containing protein n=1 Tax=Actinomadura physcomitrii TaxID=2650748 RepID=A0A6I4M746_9ACTN|nr:ABC transporter substrate-binding protein [Actinomadura physcomitrii]MWA01603.1 hypothetical protein [Actinomadura physcomitrii]